MITFLRELPPLSNNEYLFLVSLGCVLSFFTGIVWGSMFAAVMWGG